MKLPIVKIERFAMHTRPEEVTICGLETWYDARGVYNILVTERGDNPGPSVTDAHAALRRGIESWLEIPKGLDYRFYEQFDRNSYIPPRDDGDEISRVELNDEEPHWYFVPDDDWAKIYIEPRQVKPKTIRREKKNE